MVNLFSSKFVEKDIALSRARSLEGGNLSRKITINDMHKNETIDSFLN
jgi:hypothetical protein